MDSSPPRRAPRKRASRGNVGSLREKDVRRVPRKKVTSSKDPPRVRPEEPRVAAPERKAPTPIASGKAAKRRKRRQVMTIVAVLVVGMVSSAGVGYIDAGQIDVNEVIEARNERIRNNQADERDIITTSFEVPVQNTNPKVDGGLVGRGNVTPRNQPKPVVATTTGTTTDEMATSTDEMSTSTDETAEEEVSEEENTEESALAEEPEPTNVEEPAEEPAPAEGNTVEIPVATGV